MDIVLSPSTRRTKKYMVIIAPSTTATRKKTIHFGDSSSSDYTKHQNDKRKELYLTRHAKREDWTKTGLYTAGFWSRWILWNQKTIEESVLDLNKRFDLNVKFQKK